MTVKWTDKGLQRLSETLEELKKLKVTVGVQGSDTLERYPDGTTVAAVAQYNEFGTKDIPARGFMRRAVKGGGRQMATAAAEGLGGVVSRGEDPVDGLSPVAATLKNEVDSSLDTSSSWAAPNKPSTIRKKGPGKPPLYDTGRLRKALSWAVREGRQIKKEGR